MKHFNLDALSRAGWRLGSNPKPFPGRWPTRLFFQLGDRRYFGKPVALAIKPLHGQCKAFSPTDKIVEFDRGGAVYHFTPLDGVIRDGVLFKFYHYWQQPAQNGDHLLTPTHPKRIGGWNVYSPYKTLKLAYIDQWKEFAQELVRVKRARGKPIEPPKAPAQPRLYYDYELAPGAIDFQQILNRAAAQFDPEPRP